MVTTAVKIIGSDFVFGYIQAIDGEKVNIINTIQYVLMAIAQDPRNLLIIFKSSLLIVHYLPIGK